MNASTNSADFTSQPQLLRVSGSVNKVRYRADSGFTVLSATLKNEEGEDDDATVVGLMPPLDVGDSFTAEVSMEEHREYGYQYKVLNMVLEAAPSDLTEEGVAAYLEARVGGVGKVLAKRIAAELESKSEPKLEHDASTNALSRRYRAARG